MGDSQQPKPNAPQFEVPDLELEVLPRLARGVVSAPTAPVSENGTRDLFDDEFGAGGGTIEIGVSNEHHGAVHFGAGASFDALGDMQLEGNAHPGLLGDATSTPTASHTGPTKRAAVAEAATRWPTGQARARDLLAIDPAELTLLANYGAPPTSAYLTPGYAYRVFTRQRELKRALRALDSERQAAEGEREGTLAELARAVRPEAERVEQFRRLLAPLIELEQIATARGQALSSVSAELSAQTNDLNAELAVIADELSAERAREVEAQQRYDERDAAARRAEAKLKRAHIEIRAVTQVAEQKLGPRGGSVPEPEATQLAALKERAAAVEPEVNQARGELTRAKSALEQASTRVSAALQRERLVERKKQALVQHYSKELAVRSRSMNESEQAERLALAELGRALLAARGAVPIHEAWLERVRSASARADALLLRCELHLQALDAFDRARVGQGVRLACTVLALCVFLMVLKIAL